MEQLAGVSISRDRDDDKVAEIAFIEFFLEVFVPH